MLFIDFTHFQKLSVGKGLLIAKTMVERNDSIRPVGRRALVKNLRVLLIMYALQESLYFLAF